MERLRRSKHSSHAFTFKISRYAPEELTDVSPALTGCLANYLGDAAKSSFDNVADKFSTNDKTSALVNAKLTTMIEELIKGNATGAGRKIPKTRKLQIVSLPRSE